MTCPGPYGPTHHLWIMSVLIYSFEYLMYLKDREFQLETGPRRDGATCKDKTENNRAGYLLIVVFICFSSCQTGFLAAGLVIPLFRPRRLTLVLSPFLSSLGFRARDFPRLAQTSCHLVPCKYILSQFIFLAYVQMVISDATHYISQ